MKLIIYMFGFILTIIILAILYKNFNIKKGYNDKKLSKNNIKKLENELQDLDSSIGSEIFIRIFKKEKILELYIKSKKNFKLLKEYKICKYSGRLGAKLKEGDKTSPEGFYRVYKSSLNPYSNYHLALNIGYPNSYDKAHNRTGSFIMIHGKCVSTGCFAMGDKNIEEIYYLAQQALFNKQKYINIHIFPFKFGKENLNKYRDYSWYQFWLNLKEGYDYFQKNKIPPKIVVKNKRYVIKRIKST